MYEDCSICYSKCKLNVKVKQIKDDNLFGHTCDYCSRVFCKNCSHISSTEIRCLELSARILLFYCPDCINCIKAELAKQQQQSLNSQNEYENSIAILNKDLNSMRKLNNNLSEEIDKSREQINKYINDVNELSEINSNMITSIRTLEAENVSYRNQIKSLQIDIVNYKEATYLNSNRKRNLKHYDSEDTRKNFSEKGLEKGNLLQPQDKENSYRNVDVLDQCNYRDFHSPMKEGNKVAKSKVLVYGDGSAKNYSLYLRSVLEDKVYKIEGIVKAGADIGEISNSIFNVTLDYNQNDYVIVFLDVSFMSSISY